jgi:Reverse transcriptase (RNA-dependent DNA polymerase)
VPKHTKILIANPTHDHTVIRAGTRVGSIQATNIDATDSLPIGALFMESNNSWFDFNQTATRASDTHQQDATATVATVCLQPPDESTPPVTWKLQSDSEQNSDLNPTQRKRLGQFILSAAIGTPAQPSVFSTSGDLGRANEKWSSHFHNIETGDAASRTGSYEPRRNPLSNAQIDKLVDDRISLGVIEPSRSPWRFPVVLTPKSDGSMRFCVDSRRLNELTVPDSYKLPRQDDTMDALGGSTIFSVLYLSHSFHQLPLGKASRSKTAFLTRRGQYQWTTVPFGIRNRPAAFQRLLDSVLVGLTFECCLLYLDDTIGYSSSFNDHMVALDKVFTALRDTGLNLNASKCAFGVKRVTYLCHMLAPALLKLDNRTCKDE